MLNLNPSVQYSQKSHRKTISVPKNSGKLAELLGIIYGDGGINNPWQLVITLNSIADSEYAGYVKILLEELFHIDVTVRKRPRRNTLVLMCSSRNLLDLLVSKGAVRGNKIKQKIEIPNWINKNASYGRLVVRGLVDTDGCLYIHKHVTKGSSRIQKNIGFCFTNKSKDLIEFVAETLKDNDITPHLSKSGANIYLYSASSVKRYLDVFGSSNPRITKKYEQWLGLRRGGRVV